MVVTFPNHPGGLSGWQVLRDKAFRESFDRKLQHLVKSALRARPDIDGSELAARHFDLDSRHT